MHKTVVLVEPEEGLRAALVESLSSLGSDVTTVAVGDRAAAERLLAERRVDLLVADLGTSLMDGFVAACQLLRSWPQVPMLAFTRDSAPELSADLVDSLRVLRKPLDFERVHNDVLELLRRPARGHLTGVSLVGFLQLLNLEQRSVVLLVRAAQVSGRLVVHAGELVDAAADGQRGEEAAFRLLAASESQQEWEIVIEELAEPIEQTVHSSLPGLLLEGARRHDHLLHVPSESDADQETGG